MSEDHEVCDTDVFIAGSGPIGCAFAREILDKTKEVRVWMAEIGAKENPITGMHHKNSVKYQKDIDAFVHVIQGALQPVSVPPSSSYMPALSEVAWTPPPGQKLVSHFYNSNQTPELNLPGCAVTRTVGGMATHWTCACPEPSQDERKNTPIPNELPGLLQDAKKLLNVNPNEYDKSIRHTLVKHALSEKYTKERVQNLPLAVERRKDNPDLVTWSGSNTVLGPYAMETDNPRFTLNPQHKVVEIRFGQTDAEKAKNIIAGVMVHDLTKKKRHILVRAKKYIIACGSICTPQLLWKSNIRPKALGHYLTEQSIAFCQIVLKREFIEDIEKSQILTDDQRKRCLQHMKDFPSDPIHIPFTDPEPQVTMPYTEDKKQWHTQIHRDAFSYGDVGPRADPRLIVDLRFFGRQDANWDNYVTFEDKDTDIYGMPQATFNVKRFPDDAKRDHEMMLDMCEAANALGAFLPGSYPQFMPPGLALHITGTTRLGNDPNTSVANQYSEVHDVPNLYVGGNGVIPDSTACNPTLTSVAYALHSARHIAEYFNNKKESDA